MRCAAPHARACAARAQPAAPRGAATAAAADAPPPRARRAAPARALSSRACAGGVSAAALRVAVAAGASSAGRGRTVAAMPPRAAAAPDYSAVEFDMPWSPTLVPEGPWTVIEGCARRHALRMCSAESPHFFTVAHWRRVAAPPAHPLLRVAPGRGRSSRASDASRAACAPIAVRCATRVATKGA
jgi:hypothetical protein